MWRAFTGTTCSPQVPDSLRPTFFIPSTCSGHCSMSVTSWPALVSMPPTIEPMAPAPMMPILVAMSPPAVVGGALGTTHDNAAGGVGQTTLDLNVSFLAAAGDGDILAEGRLLRRGRSIAFGEARITDGAGKLVAVGRATYMLLSPKP